MTRRGPARTAPSHDQPSTEWWRARKAEEVPLERLPDAGHDEVRVQRLLDQEQLREVLPLLGER
ncbi:hypothetical protein ABZ408_40440 [Streptomyces tibetensis]